MDEHLKILRAASTDDLPPQITQDCPDFSYGALRELCDDGSMTGTPFNSVDGLTRQYSNPRITLAGRRYLAELEQPVVVPGQASEPATKPANSPKDWYEKPLGKTALPVVSGVLLALVIYLLKRHFGFLSSL